MKKTILAVILVFGALMGSAQTKVGYINTNELVALMPATDSVMKKLQKIRDQWQLELQTMQTTFQTKYNEYVQLTQLPDVLPARLEIREKELQDLQEKIEYTRNYANQDIAIKEQEFFEPIVARVKAAIARVAKAQGYDYVLDSSEGYNVLYANESHDLMAAVRIELRIPVDAKPINLNQIDNQ